VQLTSKCMGCQITMCNAQTAGQCLKTVLFFPKHLRDETEPFLHCGYAMVVARGDAAGILTAML